MGLVGRLDGHGSWLVGSLAQGGTAEWTWLCTAKMLSYELAFLNGDSALLNARLGSGQL